MPIYIDIRMNGITPNKANKRRFEIIREIGCIICKMELGVFSPCTWHHIDGQKNQEKHKLTIGLCEKHHDADQKYPKSQDYVSRHPNKRVFERRYGSEQELLEYQNRLIEEYEQI